MPKSLSRSRALIKLNESGDDDAWLSVWVKALIVYAMYACVV